MDKRQIYIVDDSDDYRYLIQQIFNKFLPEYAVHFFLDGELVLKYLYQSVEKSEELPALILMDLNMPNLNGFQTLKLIRDSDNPVFRYVKRIPVIIMSNDAIAEKVTECYEAGTNAYIKKPIEFEHLKELLKSVCHFWMQLNMVPELKK